MLIVGVVGAWWLGTWYAHLPKPLTIDWRVSSTPGYYRQPLILTFDQSVADLASIGKDVTRQVTLSPKVNGRWTWTNGMQLTFWPLEDWPAATIYRIHLSKGLFSWHARLATLTKEFESAAFAGSFSDEVFYVNPKDPSIKQVTATLHFTYPVDRASLESNFMLAMESGENVFAGASDATRRCTFTYPQNYEDCVVYVRSVNVAVPKESGHAILTLPDSVRTASGGARLAMKQQADVLVPSTVDLFHVASVQASVLANPQGDPEQTLVLVTSVGVKSADLAKALHVWILPKPKKHDGAGTDQDVETWSSPAQVDADTLLKANSVSLTLVPGDEEYATLHSFKMNVPENAYLYLEVDKGLQSVGPDSRSAINSHR